MNMGRILLTGLVLAILAGPATGTVLFQQSFDDGNAEGFTPDNAGWYVTPWGTYEVETKGFEVYAYSWAGHHFWWNYRLSFDLKVLGSINHIIALRYQNDDTFYAINMRADPFNDVYFTRWENGEPDHLASHGHTNSNGQWHHFEIIAQDNMFTVRINDGTPFVFTDASGSYFLNGGIGLVSYSGGVIQQQFLEVDNVLVESLVVESDSTNWSSVKALYR